eukprot:COSAG02_NODE_19416_length_883_cov_0.704082_2_plen_104_part_00
MVDLGRGWDKRWDMEFWSCCVGDYKLVLTVTVRIALYEKLVRVCSTGWGHQALLEASRSRTNSELPPLGSRCMIMNSARSLRLCKGGGGRWLLEASRSPSMGV